MRIGIDATCCFNRRGFGRFTQQLLRALVRAFPEHEYVLLVDRDAAPGDVPEGCEVVNARPARTVTASAVAGDRRTLGEMLAFTLAARRARPDVFFFPAVYSYFPLPLRLRSVVCFHDTIAEDFPELVFPNRTSRWAWGAKVRLALWQATRIMTISAASRASLMRHFGVKPDEIDVVTEGPSPGFGVLDDRERVRATLRSLNLADRPYLLFVGGISPHKNLTTLLDAMQKVLPEHEVRLVMVGDLDADGFLANPDELRARIDADERLRASCVFTGFVSDEDLVDLYNGATALVFPSLGEGFGLPAVEAMASGIPVLASNAGSLPEVVGDAGLFYDPLDASAMAREISRFLDDDELRADLGKRAIVRARQFTWERAAELAMASLERAVNGWT